MRHQSLISLIIRIHIRDVDAYTTAVTTPSIHGGLVPFNQRPHLVREGHAP